MKIVIIEDEELTAEDLAMTISSVSGSSTISRTLYSVSEAVNYFKTAGKPDLIFSDIELGDGLSFEIFKKAQITTPVIFCTAYNEYALQAFKANGIDYILKPFDKRAVSAAIEKFTRLKEPILNPVPDYNKLLSLLGRNLPTPNQSLLTYAGDKIIPIKLTDISLVYSQEEKSYAVYGNNKTSLVNHPLDELENIMGNQFYRANRHMIVNRKIIKEVAQHFNRKLLLILTISFPEQVFVSKAKASHFLSWLKE